MIVGTVLWSLLRAYFLLEAAVALLVFVVDEYVRIISFSLSESAQKSAQS
jgi:hypothetical protein